MSLENVITGLYEEVTSAGGCENDNINALIGFKVSETPSRKTGCESDDVILKRSREEAVLVEKSVKTMRLGGYNALRVRRNVKWATKLEEHWDGLEKRQPFLFKPHPAGLKSILKKEPVSCPSPVSMCQNATSSELSYTSDEDQQTVEKPRRLKFKLRYGCRNAYAQRHGLLTM